MRFIVTQMGARRGYAVPLILEQAGLLERFYTDLAGNIGLGRWLAKCGRLLGCRKAAARLATRRVPAAIRPKTVTLTGGSLWSAFRRSLKTDPAARFREQLRWSRVLGDAVARRGFGKATHLYSMLGEFGPVLGAARKQGLSVVMEVYILLSTERILAQEQHAFPGWEPLTPDLDPIRKEFAEQCSLVDEADLLICPSNTVRDDLEVNFALRRGKTAVVPYGIDQKWLKQSPEPLQGGVLFVGTAGLRKGLPYLARAAESLHQQGKKYEFRIAGDVNPQIVGHPITRHLKFMGRVPREDIHREYARADVFVLPSLAEGSAEATYEAMATGLPIVTTKATGSVIRNGKEGWIVPERNAGALAEAIARVVEDRELRTRMSRAARERAHDYTLERYGHRLVEALQSFRQ